MNNNRLRNIKTEFDANMEAINMENLIELVRTEIIYVAYKEKTSLEIPGIQVEGIKKMPYKLEDAATLEGNETVNANFLNTLSRYYTRYTFKKVAPVLISGLQKSFPEMKIVRDSGDKGITFNW